MADPPVNFLSKVPSRTPLGRRRYLGLTTIIPFALAALMLVFLVTGFDVDLAGTWERIKSSNPLLFVLAILVHYTTFAFRGGRWRVLLRNVQPAGTRVLGVAHCSALMLMAWFVNSLVWFRLGDAYRAYAYAEHTGESFFRTIGTVLAERVLDVTMVFLLIVAGALTLAIGGADASWGFVVVAAVLTIALLAMLLGMALFRWRLAHLLPARLQEFYQRFHQGTIGSFRRLPMVTLLSLLSWLAEVGRLYLVTEAVGVDISLGLIILVAVANALLTLIPLTPGGLGLVEPGIVGLLMISLPREEALPVALLDRSISFLSLLLVGGVVFLAYQLLKRRGFVAEAPQTESAQQE